MGPERTPRALLAPSPVLSPSCITLENNGKIRPKADREKRFSRASGGETGIRTLGTLSRSTVFKTAAFDHSATSPVLGRFKVLQDNTQEEIIPSHEMSWPTIALKIPPY